MPCGSLRHIPRVVEVVRQSLHGPQLCLGEPLPRVRTRCNCWLDQARRCHEEAGQQTHQYVHADCVSNCMANGVLLHTVTCQELVSMKTLPDDLYDTRQSLHGPQLLPLPLLPELAGCALSCPLLVTAPRLIAALSCPLLVTAPRLIAAPRNTRNWCMCTPANAHKAMCRVS